VYVCRSVDLVERGCGFDLRGWSVFVQGEEGAGGKEEKRENIAEIHWGMEEDDNNDKRRWMLYVKCMYVVVCKEKRAVGLKAATL